VVAGEADMDEEVESPVASKDGGTRLIAWRNSVLRGADGRVTGTLSSGEDITERRRAQEHVTYLAFHDQLTGLANRSMLAERLHVAVSRAARSGDSVGLLCLDVDDFKLVNDSLGHAVGDELLVAVAGRLGRAKRHDDVLARAGGDEFFLLLPSMPSEAEGDALTAARRLAAAFDRPFEVESAELHVSASVGISLFPRDAADADELLRHADTAMYQAKGAGRGSLTLYSPEDQDPLERLSLTSRLRGSLERRCRRACSSPPPSTAG
jgi:diguanylate cyclase (GGDEF)-like protein